MDEYTQTDEYRRMIRRQFMAIYDYKYFLSLRMMDLDIIPDTRRGFELRKMTPVEYANFLKKNGREQEKKKFMDKWKSGKLWDEFQKDTNGWKKGEPF